MVSALSCAKKTNGKENRKKIGECLNFQTLPGASGDARGKSGKKAVLGKQPAEERRKAYVPEKKKPGKKAVTKEDKIRRRMQKNLGIGVKRRIPEKRKAPAGAIEERQRYGYQKRGEE